MANRKMTIEKLAGMMNMSFQHLESRLDSFEKNVNERFEAVDERFETMDKRFDTLEKISNGHENRLSRVEDDVRLVKTALGV